MGKKRKNITKTRRRANLKNLHLTHHQHETIIMDRLVLTNEKDLQRTNMKRNWGMIKVLRSTKTLMHKRNTDLMSKSVAPMP